MLGVACGNIVELYKDPCVQDVEYPYLTHKVYKSITDIKFAPYEDVLGIGHAAGFSSILVPGKHTLQASSVFDAFNGAFF